MGNKGNQNEIKKLNSQVKQLKKDLKKVIKQKNRYQEIIDVSLINQTTNEQRIRSLNKYLLNLKKIQGEIDMEYALKQRENIQLKNDYKKIYCDYIKREENQQAFISKFR